MNTQEKIAVMQAYVDGKTIQWKRFSEASDVQWNDFGRTTAGPAWSWDECNYRIKPEPRKFLIACKINDATNTYVFANEAARKNFLSYQPPGTFTSCEALEILS